MKTDRPKSKKQAAQESRKSKDPLRKRAEALVKKRFGKIKPEAFSDRETQRLIHELQTHQIELEIQNEELRNSQIALEEARKRYADLYDMAPVGYFSFDRKGIVLEANLAGASMLDTDRARLIGSPFVYFLRGRAGKGDAGRIFNLHIRDVLKTDGRRTCELEITSRDGTKFFAYLESVPSNGSTIRTVISDVTDRRKVEERLRESEENFRTIFEQAAVGIAHVALDGKYIRFNEKLCDITGFPAKELSLLRFQDITHPDDLTADIKSTQRLLRSEIPSYLREKRYIRKDGSTTWVNIAVSVARDASGAPMYFVVIVEEIGARKKAEEERKAISDRYRSYIEVTGQIGWATDARGRVTEDLPYWRSYTGQTYAEIKGWGWTNALHPDDVDQTAHLWRNAVTNKMVYEAEYRLRRHDGVYRLFLARGVPILEDDGAVREWVGTCIDITERKLAEVALQLRTSEIEAVNKELEAFSYTVSHDLKSPLRSIEGFTRALTEDYADRLDDTGRDYLRRVNEASTKMSQLIEAILTMSRQTKGEILETAVDLSKLARTIADEFKRMEPGRKVEFVITDGIRVKGDRAMLELVMQNLLQNSWKFTGKHDSARIEFGISQHGAVQVYYVRDDGAGFDMEYADKLFMPFMRLHSESDFPGLGIGLTTVHRIISRHGGRIWAEGEPDKGATFYFSLG